MTSLLIVPHNTTRGDYWNAGSLVVQTTWCGCYPKEVLLHAHISKHRPTRVSTHMCVCVCVLCMLIDERERTCYWNSRWKEALFICHNWVKGYNWPSGMWPHVACNRYKHFRGTCWLHNHYGFHLTWWHHIPSKYCKNHKAQPVNSYALHHSLNTK
jgi:hypothetical protein